MKINEHVFYSVYQSAFKQFVISRIFIITLYCLISSNTPTPLCNLEVVLLNFTDFLGSVYWEESEGTAGLATTMIKS